MLDFFYHLACFYRSRVQGQQADLVLPDYPIISLKFVLVSFFFFPLYSFSALKETKKEEVGKFWPLKALSHGLCWGSNSPESDVQTSNACCLRFT
jgi:hypothetical protein